MRTMQLCTILLFRTRKWTLLNDCVIKDRLLAWYHLFPDAVEHDLCNEAMNKEWKIVELIYFQNTILNVC